MLLEKKGSVGGLGSGDGGREGPSENFTMSNVSVQLWEKHLCAERARPKVSD